MKPKYKDEINIFVTSLRKTIEVFEIIKKSNQNEKEQIKYLINVSEELKLFCNGIIPSLKKLIK